MSIAHHVCYNDPNYIDFEIMTCHAQLSNIEIIRIDAFKCVKGQVQYTLSEVQVVVSTQSDGTISPRVCQNNSANREPTDALDENENGEDEHDGDEDAAEDEGDEGEDDDAYT